MNLPGVSLVDVALAATYAQLGDGEAARHAIRELLAIRPDYAAIARQELGKWFDVEIVEHLLDGLRKAGLDVMTQAAVPDPTASLEAATRAAATKPSIAVLPFANMSADKDQDYFSDGLAEEIINLLAHIDGLRVIARTSRSHFVGKSRISPDRRSAGRHPCARRECAAGRGAHSCDGAVDCGDRWRARLERAV